MSTQQQAQLDESAVEAGVAEYLTQNPGFFERRPDVLTELQLKHDCGGASSLLEYQAKLLRERNRSLQRRLEDLLAVARDNDRLAERLHQLTLELMDAGSLESVIDCLKSELRNNFQADAVAVRLFGEGDEQFDWVRPNDPSLTALTNLARDPRPVCGRIPREQLEFLFGDTATAIGSSALVPLVDGRVLGVLAIGSYKSDRFHANQGTVFLRQLGATVGRAMRRYLPGQ